MSLNERHISIAGTVIALAALIISIKSCQQSEKALYFQSQDYINKVTTVWSGDVNKDESTIEIHPTNDKVVLQKAMVTFPDEISDTMWPIEMPDHALHMRSQIVTIQELVEQRIPKRLDHTIMLDDYHIPIVIESRYIANAQIYEDRSLYSIDYNAIVWSDKYQKPSVILNGLSFLRLLSPEENAKSVVNDLWGIISKEVPIN